MSIKLMCLAFDSEIPATQKLVLLALCDNANEQGQCFPSIALLERKCSLSDRAVQSSLSWLEQHGYLSRNFRVGRATIYVVTPERGSPPNDVHPRSSFTPPPNVVHPTPERGSPLTIKESSSKHKSRGTRIPFADLPDEWSAFCRSERPELNPVKVWDSFHDYWIAIPGAKGVKTDWFATWRNWVRNQRQTTTAKQRKDDSWQAKLASLNTIDMEPSNGQVLSTDIVPF